MIQTEIGPHEDLLTIIKRQKLQWYGHVSRSSGLAKTILRSERGKKTRQTEEEVGRQHQGMDRPGEQWRTGENGENWLKNHLWCPTTLADMGQMMMDGQPYTDDKAPILFLCCQSTKPQQTNALEIS